MTKTIDGIFKPGEEIVISLNDGYSIRPIKIRREYYSVDTSKWNLSLDNK